MELLFSKHNKKIFYLPKLFFKNKRKINLSKSYQQILAKGTYKECKLAQEKIMGKRYAMKKRNEGEKNGKNMGISKIKTLTA